MSERGWDDDRLHELFAKTRPGVEIGFPDWLILPTRRPSKVSRPL